MRKGDQAPPPLQTPEREALRSAAHDLNNQLGIILGNADVLRLGGPPGLDAELAAIEEACRRCKEIALTVQQLGRHVEPGQPAAPPPPAEAQAAPALDGSRALVVDDEPAMLRVAGHLMERCGYSVVTVTSARAAVAALEDGPFGVVLTDFAMPGATGLALLGEVAARWPQLPAVLMTGNVANAELAETARREHRVLLRKPFTLADLREAIARARLLRSQQQVIDAG